MLTSLVPYVNSVAIYSFSFTPSTIRTTGLIFMGFGIAYLVYRWFRDR